MFADIMPYFPILVLVAFAAILSYAMRDANKGNNLFITQKLPPKQKCQVYQDRTRDGEFELALFHKFVQDYWEDKGEYMYFPAAIVEFENGALEIVPVNHIIMIREKS